MIELWWGWLFILPACYGAACFFAAAALAGGKWGLGDFLIGPPLVAFVWPVLFPVLLASSLVDYGDYREAQAGTNGNRNPAGGAE